MIAAMPRGWWVAIAVIALGAAASGTSAPLSQSNEGRILFVSRDDIVVMNGDGTHRRNITRTTGRAQQESEAQWSPDGSRIAFIAHGARAGVHVTALTGNGDRLVAPMHAHQPTWLDARRLLFVGFRSLSQGEIHVVHPDGSGMRNLTNGRGNDGSPAASPDGRRIAFARRGSGAGVYRMNADGSDQTRLTNVGNVLAISWSPDGRRILVERADGRGSAIYVISADGSDLRRLVRNPDLSSTQPTWSPDGRTIAFASMRGGSDFEIFRMRYDGSGLRNLTRDPSSAQTSPVWSPDGRRIAYLDSDASGTLVSQVNVMTANGTGKQSLTRARSVSNLAWAPAP